MIKKSHLSRPAASAIAAFLALSTTALAAQTPVLDGTSSPMVRDDALQIKLAQPVLAPKVPVEPATTSPISTETSMSSETVAPPMVAIPEARAPSNVKPERKAISNSAQSRISAAPKDAATQTSAVPPPAVPNISNPAVTAPTTLPAAPQNVLTVNDGTALMWSLLGGSAALLLIASTGWAVLRRRRIERPVTAPVETRMMDVPPITDALVAIQAQEAANPMMASRGRPAVAAAPMGNMGRHEVAAMAGPTADNPFLTLKKRLTHARFYDRKERAEHEATSTETVRKPASAWDITNRPDAAPVREQVVRRPGRSLIFPAHKRPGFTVN